MTDNKSFKNLYAVRCKVFFTTDNCFTRRLRTDNSIVEKLLGLNNTNSLNHELLTIAVPVFDLFIIYNGVTHRIGDSNQFYGKWLNVLSILKGWITKYNFRRWIVFGNRLRNIRISNFFEYSVIQTFLDTIFRKLLTFRNDKFDCNAIFLSKQYVIEFCEKKIGPDWQIVINDKLCCSLLYLWRTSITPYKANYGL